MVGFVLYCSFADGDINGRRSKDILFIGLVSIRISILYDFDMEEMEFYHDLPTETRMLMNELWEELKIESTIGTGIYIICAVIVLGVAAWGIFLFVRKKIRASYYD